MDVYAVFYLLKVFLLSAYMTFVREFFKYALTLEKFGSPWEQFISRSSNLIVALIHVNFVYLYYTILRKTGTNSNVTHGTI